jgi:hypothetical protein
LILKVFALVLLALVPAALRAQVYTWVEPGSGETRGETRISTIPPAWYRQPYQEPIVHAPRVIVSIGTAVIDDTAWPLAKRLELFQRRNSRPTSARR